MSEHQSSYRQIFKATSIFGGVQIINIIIQVVRSKATAVFLGPAGMGIMGLLTSSLGLIASATNFGLGTSAVKDIAAANGTGNTEKISETVSVFRKLIWLTGGLGMLLTLILSPLLSYLTFGNFNYTLAFIILSSSLLINQLTSGQAVLLQGLRKITWLAKAGIIGSVIGLIVTVFLFYFLGEKGIVPVVIIGALTALVIQYFFSKRIKIQPREITFKEAIERGKPMLKLGFMLSLSGFITISLSYVERVYLNWLGGVSVVGLFNAGFTIINVYVGMVFSAMATDYYPRLSTIKDDVQGQNKLIAQQAEMALFILSPMIIIFLVFITLIIKILYSDAFLPTTGMIHWAILGVFFKAVSWSMGFQILSKGDSKAFFWNELITALYIFLFNLIGYYWGGLTGMGISFFIGYFVHFLQMYIFCSRKYGLHLDATFWKIFVLYVGLGLIGFVMALTLSSWWLYGFGSLLILITVAVSFYFLNQKTDLLNFVRTKMKR